MSKLLLLLHSSPPLPPPPFHFATAPILHHRATTLLRASILSKKPPNLSSSLALFRKATLSSSFLSRSSSFRCRTFSVRAFDSDDSKTEQEEEKEESFHVKKSDEDYPSGDFDFQEIGAWNRFLVKLKMLIAFPWERVRKGSVLTMKLRGQISDQLKSRFSSGLSLPQICENFIKAAYDPRISGIYLHIDGLNCGWAKVEEIRRHIFNFKKSGKFVVAYLPACREKEYYLASACDDLYLPPAAYFSFYGFTVQAAFLAGVFEKVGIQPDVQRIGKYKSAGDQLTRKSMSKENCEMLTAILDNIYGNWLDKVSSTKGKKIEDMKNFINEGVYKVERLKEEGLITNMHYDDEVISMLKEKVGVQKDKVLPMVDYRKYSRVRNWTLGLTGGRDLIAIIRASGSISRVKSPLSLSGSGIIGEQLIEKIRQARESKKYKAAIIRIDSPGGDALASDLMWREIRLLAESKPVIASMSDVAASGGYYMAMAADTIVAENLTLTGSIGVVTGKFSLGKLYEKIGFNKEIISRGKYAELLAADQRPLRPDEAELFAKSAQNAYEQFRDKAAFSRSMPVDKMEEVAQGRVWTGQDAASRGLVDAIGGFSRAVAIAKQKANIPQDRQVMLVELSRPSPTLPEILSGIGSSVVGAERTLKELLQDSAFSNGVQARMDGILFQGLEEASYDNPILTLIKDYLGSL
ncbi:PREDICTED: serine protease SPPA, chloroplastic [Populus euphratica]|uniref:Serine protease SPPA, chloroplastic n=1 Tax=Populus euphratica TaxID=75702 RepID=A0AAJ6XDK5_POPEU|nr:PREDICTED: serine protease SPPA, chloroplastic [Populus euphratica]